MRIVMSGSSGLIGNALLKELKKEGHEVIHLVRGQIQAKSSDAVFWDPSQGILDPATFEGVDAVIHLAGENIATGRWNAEKKRDIRDSRVLSTLLIADVMAKLPNPPKVLINASAMGYYGLGRREVTEESGPGDGFLADVCVDWEGATTAAKAAGIRVVLLRLGAVLSKEGGALKRMLFPFKLGLGGVIGSGDQTMPWIEIQDVCGIVHYCLFHEEIKGPINVVAPQLVNNREFTKTLGSVLNRPTILPMPKWALRLALGEFADEILLNQARIHPKKLKEIGYCFLQPNLKEALESLLNH